ncbi:MAG: putative baseplate assembly protein [Rhodanobacter sp.]
MSCCNACGKHACAGGCGATSGTPLPLYNRPGLDRLAYRVGTYGDFRSTMQGDLSRAGLPALAGLRTRESDDPSMALLDAWAVTAEVLSFYTERIANEGYLCSATERRSVLELARLVDYRLRPGVSASVHLAYTVEKDSPPVTIPAGAQAQSIPAPGEQMQTFETTEPLDARFEWNALKPRLSQPQVISLDSVLHMDELWLAGTATQLKTSDRLLFLFGDDLADGTQVVRLVQAVEAQQANVRSRVVLQPMDAATVQILAAADAVTASLRAPGAAADAEEWLGLIGKVRSNLLLGGDNGGSYAGLVGPYMLRHELKHESPTIATFKHAVDSAFGGSLSVATPAVGFGALFGALTLNPTLQPASSLQLSRSVRTALGTASDTRPQLLLHFAPELSGTFYRAWTSVSQGQPPQTLHGVYAMRLAAPLFGYNAPRIMGLRKNRDSATSADLPFVSKPAGDWPTAEENDRVQLDNAYDGVLAGSYLLIIPPVSAWASRTVAQARSVQTHPRTDYGISGKTTDIALLNPAVDDKVQVWPAPGMAILRGTQVYAQSEPLLLANLVLADEVGASAAHDTSTRTTGDSATQLTLDTAVDGLKAGRWVIVAGQRSDVPGTDAVTAAELVMLAAVQQDIDAKLPGDTVHSTLQFANQGLAYRYRRDSVSVHANVVRATHGQTRHEVLGSGNGALPMQVFALKQKPLTWVSAATPDGVQSTLELRVNDVQWHETRNLAFVGEDARRFVTATDDSGTTSVRFGDGAHGARLPTGVENIKAFYRNGIGASGNVDAQQISLLATKPLGVKEVLNPLRASGGADPETRDQARSNVPLAVRALDRLVSVADYADFARTFGGVGKATAVKSGNGVQVTIAGADDVPIDATSDLHRNLLDALQRYGDPALPVRLREREWLALTLSAKVGLAPDYVWESVEPVLRAALLDAFGFEWRALGQPAWLSVAVACIQGVRGVAWVDVDAFDCIDRSALLAGFATVDQLSNEQASGAADRLLVLTQAGKPDPSGVGQRLLDHIVVQPHQIAYLSPAIPDTLLLQEATS